MRIIAGKAKGIKLATLKGKQTRPTLDRVKESLFSILYPWLKDSIAIDFFSGSGNLCIESLSRGAQKAYFIERSPHAVKIIQENLTRTNFHAQAEIIPADFREGARILSERRVKGDILFVDPPHAGDMVSQTLQLIEDLHLLAKDGIIIAEHHSEQTMPECVGHLEKVRIKVFGNTTLTFYQRSHIEE
ncbi:MAG: 16S rRNA (guanine(966)-N(2))-methyltransferase RsmD [Tissierellia bacterium]|nr:16S rRNA (guanine(966)-N(2))-methyltransferase RsmD [Bacillota bacterium]NLL22644.1 16S rRNA (guanine(966)-N(2))-methyltransferase RsmD [Tissierellia bacterium]